MALDSLLLWSFLLVFVRCSAMLLSSPVFGAQTTPLPIRIMTTLAISAALTLVIEPKIGKLPEGMDVFVMALLNEAVAGLLIGMFMSLVLHAAGIAGALLDMQMGLSMSQILNPLNGVHVTVLSQFKFLLATVLYLAMNGHHLMLTAFVKSYNTMPTFGLASLPGLQQSMTGMITTVFLIALQIAAPVMAVSLVIDAALGLMNKAVPQMQPLAVGVPAKAILGLITLSLALPALAMGVQSGVDKATVILGKIFGM